MRFVTPLTLEQQGELAGLHRGGCSHRVRQRAHAILLSAKGYSLDQAAQVLGVDRDAVSRGLCRWEQGGAGALQDAAKPGRPRKLTASEQEQLVAAAQAHPASPPRELAKKGA